MIDTKKTALSSTHIPNPGINIPSLTIRRVYENRTRDFVCVCVVYSEWGVFGVGSIRSGEHFEVAMETALVDIGVG